MPSNILLIHSDQHRYDCVHANGHAFIETPALDRLATEGARFTHAFCASPVCVPTRNSLHFGVWPTRHGVVINHGLDGSSEPAEGLAAFSDQVASAGYTLGWVGKFGVARHTDPKSYGFEEYLPADRYGSWRSERGLPPVPHTNRWFGEADPGVLPDQSRLGWGATETIAMLERLAGGERPFFLRWDPPEPHPPNIVPEPYASRYEPASIPPWPSFGDTFEGKPYIQAQQLRTWGLDQWTWADWQPIVSRYLGELSLLDRQVGRILNALDRLGLADDTLVVYSCDHGDTCGGHGMIDKHYIMYDDLVRIPLFVRWPGHVAPGTVCDEFVTAPLDLAATFCEAAGAPVPETYDGVTLGRTLAEGSGRDAVFATYSGAQFGLYSQRMARERRWKYVWNPTAEDELYDLESDPGELRNLARDEAAAEHRERLRQRLVAWMESTSDPLLNGWTRTQLLERRKV